MGLINSDSPFLADLDFDNLSLAQQARINALIDAHTELIQKYCNRVFLADDFEEIHSGNGLTDIFVRNLPINSLASITFLANDSDDNEVYAATNFRLISELGQIQWHFSNEFTTDEWAGAFRAGYENYQVNYNGGFAVVPQPIQMLCSDLVIASYNPSLGVGNYESEKLGQYSYKLASKTFSSKLSNNQQILNLYKIVSYVP